MENISISSGQGSNQLKVVSTGLADLDIILGGGVPVGSLIILLGVPGSGKTTLLQQLCFAWTAKRSATAANATNSEASSNNIPPTSNAVTAVTDPANTNTTNPQPTTAKALYFSTLSEPHEKIVQHMSQFSFFDQSKIGSSVQLFSLTHAMKLENANEIATFIVRIARQEKAELVVLDGVGALLDLFSQTSDIRYFLNQLSAQLNALGVTSVLALEQSFLETNATGILTGADGIINMYANRRGATEYHRIEVRKLRGMPRLEGLHTYVFNRKGLIFYPRLEALTREDLAAELESLSVNSVIGEDAESEPALTSEVEDDNVRLSFGLPELENMLGGGVPINSSTFVAGSPGVGKTLLSLHFLMEGVAKEEPCLYVGFYEKPHHLIQKAANFNLDLKSAIRDGKIKVLTASPVELEPDQIAYLIKQVVEEYHIQRVVIDGILELELACREEGRSRAYTSALDSYFKERGVTAFYTYTISKLIGSELDLSDTVFTMLAENLILMRQVAYQSHLYRVISVLKMRDSEYDTSIRQFTIKREVGIRVLDPDESGPEWLQGLAQNLDENATPPEQTNQSN